MIELQRVYKRYPGQSGRALLDDIDLCVDPGEVVLLSGPGSAGKSTLLGLLYGACFATSGTVSMFGRDVARLRRSSIALLRRCVGVVPQLPMLMPERSVFDNVAIALEARAEPRRTIRVRTMSALESVGLARWAGCPITGLAAGERQWVAIARALVGEPRVLIVDQPTAWFARRDRDRFIDLVAEAARRGTAAVIATNDHTLLCAGARLAWRHVELRDGALEVVADRQPENKLSISTAETETEYASLEVVEAVEAVEAVESVEAVAVGEADLGGEVVGTIYSGGAFGTFEAIDDVDTLWTVDSGRWPAAGRENPEAENRADEHRAAENVVPFPRAAAGGIAE